MSPASGRGNFHPNHPGEGVQNTVRQLNGAGVTRRGSKMTDAMIERVLNVFDLNEKQRIAVLERGKDVVVTAGAGSGKTSTLVARYACLLAEGGAPRQYRSPWPAGRRWHLIAVRGRGMSYPDR